MLEGVCEGFTKFFTAQLDGGDHNVRMLVEVERHV